MVNTDKSDSDNSEAIEEQKTPDELIAEARTILTSPLEVDLLSKIADNISTFFEELVAKLLLSMVMLVRKVIYSKTEVNLEMKELMVLLSKMS